MEIADLFKQLCEKILPERLGDIPSQYLSHTSHEYIEGHDSAIDEMESKLSQLLEEGE